MAGKWTELAERTSQSVHEATSTLEALSKPLLHPDPAQRPTLAAMLNHPYLQHAGPIKPPLTSEPVQMSAALPSMHSVMPTVQPPALLLPEMGPWSELEAVPGMGSVLWAPKSHYLYATMPGNVFRCVNAVCDLAHQRMLLCIGGIRALLLPTFGASLQCFATHPCHVALPAIMVKTVPLYL